MPDGLAQAVALVGGGIVRRGGGARPVTRVAVRTHQPSGKSAPPWSTTEILVANTVLEPTPPGNHVDATDADAAVADLYGTHYGFLVRVAVLLGHDGASAEEVVQDSFAETCADMHHLRDSGEAASFLLAAVVNRSRRELRRSAAGQNASKREPTIPVGEHCQFASLERSEVMAALRKLPDRQREVVVLRYYGNLSEQQIATTVGITVGAVRRLASRAMAALRSALQRAP
jgi:RNA polymerase sigma factor (sigma-70 family)